MRRRMLGVLQEWGPASLRACGRPAGLSWSDSQRCGLLWAWAIHPMHASRVVWEEP